MDYHRNEATELKNTFENKLFHRKTPLKLPTPHFVVLYNGTEDSPDHFTLTLSDHYIQQEENPALQLKAEVYNGSCPDLHSKSMGRPYAFAARSLLRSAASRII